MAEELESVESRGVLAGSARKLAELLAETAPFQERVGAVSVAEALAKVWHPHRIFSTAEEPTGPFAVIWANSFEMDQGQGPFLRLQSVTLRLMLHDVDRFPDNPIFSQIDFTNWIDDIAEALAALQGSDERLVIQRLALPEGSLIPPSLQAAGEQKPYWTACLDVTAAALRR